MCAIRHLLVTYHGDNCGRNATVAPVASDAIGIAKPLPPIEASADASDFANE